MSSLATRFVAILAVAAFSIGNVANADTIAGWTFETSIPTTAGPHAAEIGVGAALGFHASGSVVYSNPAGNGSAESFSSNFWAAGDYYQFSVATTGLSQIMFVWDQTGSSTGPRDFDLQYDAGSGFVTATSYSLTGESWSSGTNNPLSTRSFDFSSITALNDNASVQFRLTMTGSTSINGGSVATAGTGRVDNIFISGTAIPEPTSLCIGLLGLVGVAGLSRRRSS